MLWWLAVFWRFGVGDVVVVGAVGVDAVLSVIGGVRMVSGDGLIGRGSMFDDVVESNSGLTVGRVVVVGRFGVGDVVVVGAVGVDDGLSVIGGVQRVSRDGFPDGSRVSSSGFG